jgi:hypothetical protein
MADLYDQYFRIPTIELQSSHADLKIKDNEEEEKNYAKVIEGTNQIMIFDKKMNKIIKKKIKIIKKSAWIYQIPVGVPLGISRRKIIYNRRKGRI